MEMELERIILGSGTLYIAEFASSIPADAALEVEANLFGRIQGGAELEYKPSFYEAKDDSGLVSKVIITEEEVTLKSGIMTLNGNTLKKLSPTARVTEAAGKRTVKIGGVGNQDGKKYLLRFVYEDPVDGDVRLTIVGTNQSGFVFAFKKDKETIIDATFKAQPLDGEGTLVIYDEEGVLGALAVTSVAGTAVGTTKITVAPTLTEGDSYVYKTAATVTLPLAYDVCDTEAGYTTWNGTADITATTDNEIVIVEVDAAGKAVKAGKATVVSKT